MSDQGDMTHAEALRLIDERIGERVYLGLFLKAADEGPDVMFMARSARLLNPLSPRPPRLEADTGFYGLGDATESYPFPPIAAAIELRDAGLDFHLAGGGLIRVAWRGSSEVGDGPDVGTLARLRLTGSASEEESRQDDASVELKRFLQGSTRAMADVLSAEPTDARLRTPGGEERRVWKLRLRVLPGDEGPFEADAEVLWPLAEKVEDRLAAGESLSCLPTTEKQIEVAFDPDDRREVMAYPYSPFDAEPVQLRAAIVVSDASDQSPPVPPPLV